MTNFKFQINSKFSISKQAAAVVMVMVTVTTGMPFQAAQALQMPVSAQEMVLYERLTASSYVVMDADTGETLLSKDPARLWVPASLTKLVTALVVLDSNPNLKKSVAMVKADEVGGARIATKAGVKYTVNDLLHATLIASANNAANALARSTGLSREDFVKLMNEKAVALGATHTILLEPSGINEKNITTAEDYAKIIKASFQNPLIAEIAQTPSYTFRSTNNTRYVHTIKNTNKLLGDSELAMVGGKTGYLDESKYNFAADIQDRFGNKFIVVLLGSASSSTQFQETKKLALLGGLAKAFFGKGSGSLFGAAPGNSLSIFSLNH